MVILCESTIPLIKNRLFFHKGEKEENLRIANMHLHEYQTKELLHSFGIASPPFGVATCREEIGQIVRELSLSSAVIKAQILSGGRGKAGGVLFGTGIEEILSRGEELLSKKLVTRQSGPKGLKVERILLTPQLSFEREYYVAITFDRQKKAIVLLFSAHGGVNVEEEGRSSIHREYLNPGRILHDFQYRHIAQALFWQTREEKKRGREFFERLIRAFFATDSSLLEINPLIMDDQKNLLALDAKASIDENSAFRQENWAASEDLSALSTLEREAHSSHLQYHSLQGNIGCMVNGAGLAMATMDFITTLKGEVANFLDIGGGATGEQIERGLHILSSDPQIEVILINIFGGIVRCSLIAQAILSTLDHLPSLPLIIRLEGTEREEGLNILEKKVEGEKILLAKNWEEISRALLPFLGKDHLCLS